MANALPSPTDCCQVCCTDTTTSNLATTVQGIIAFDTKAALKAFTAYFNRMYVAVLGGAALGDGNGGNYYFNSTSTAADDGGTVLRPNDLTAAQAGRWIQHGI